MQLLSNLGINASRKQDTFFIDPGLIVEYFGASNTIPEGWALCDGTNGTPDLRNRFVVGAGSTYSIGNTGGFTDTIVPSHGHTASNTNTVGNHTHGINLGSTFLSVFFDRIGHRTFDERSLSTQAGGSHSHSSTVSTTGTTGVNANLPPYYGLFYIMKMEE